MDGYFPFLMSEADQDHQKDRRTGNEAEMLTGYFEGITGRLQGSQILDQGDQVRRIVLTLPIRWTTSASQSARKW